MDISGVVTKRDSAAFLPGRTVFSGGTWNDLCLWRDFTNRSGDSAGGDFFVMPARIVASAAKNLVMASAKICKRMSVLHTSAAAG